MLRLAVLILLLANAGYYAWSHGALQALGLGPTNQSEPQRLQQQVEPHNLRLLPPQPQEPAPSAPPVAPAAPAESTESNAAAGEALACLQAGPFDALQADDLRQAAAQLPKGSWSLAPVPVAGRWMVYMGRFPDEEALAKKRTELRALKIAFDRPGPALEPGLSLGRYSTAEGALRALSQLGEQGVRRARVVQERGETPTYTLRLPAVSQAQRAQTETALRAVLAGKTLRPCG